MTEGWYVQDSSKAYVAGPFGRKATASQWIEDWCPPRENGVRERMQVYSSYRITYIRAGETYRHKPTPTDADCRTAAEAIAVLVDMPPFPLAVYGLLSMGLDRNAIHPTSSCFEDHPGLQDAIELKLAALVEKAEGPSRWYLTDLGYLAACVMKEGFYAG